VLNVVTYNVVLDVANKDELLKPGMTAQVRLLVGNRENVLRIPTAALRFRLSDEEQEKELKKQKEANNGKKASSASTTAGSNANAVTPAPAADDDIGFRSKSETARSFKIYKLNDKNQPKPLDIKIGLSNFRYTEVLSGDLKTGDKVVTRAFASGDEGHKE
jgi:HlyD family secretion protein